MESILDKFHCITYSSPHHYSHNKEGTIAPLISNAIPHSIGKYHRFCVWVGVYVVCVCGGVGEVCAQCTRALHHPFLDVQRKSISYSIRVTSEMC